MQLLVSIIPGVAFASVVFLLVISVTQFYIYAKEGYRRSQSIALFSLFAALVAMEHVFAQSRLLPPMVLYYYLMISTPAAFASYFYYVKSLNHFIAFPNWFYKSYRGIAALLFFVALLPVPADLLFNTHLLFNPQQLIDSGNYFVDSYTNVIGAPQIFINALLSSGAVLIVVSSFYILRVVLRSTRDAYFIAGLILSIASATLENFMLPFTLTFFVPVIFLSNLFEAFRMNTLANQEYVRERQDNRAVTVVDETEKYQNSNLSEERIQVLSDRVKEIFKREQIFLNPNLHLEDVARKAGIPNYQLSQVINSGMGTSFFELLSEYRIEYVKRKLKENTSGKIIEFAYEAGFNSKSAFNTAFKKKTGMTPSDFRKHIDSL